MTRPRRIEIPYPGDSAALFERFAHLPWAAFLDSGQPRAEQGRYDFLTAEPHTTLTTRGPLTEIRRPDATQVSEADPFALLRGELGEPLEPMPGLPFAGGALGYFAYDLGRRIERLPETATDDVGLPEMAIGLYDWVVAVDHLERRAWFVGRGRDSRTFDCWDELLRRVLDEAPAARSKPAALKVLAPVVSNMDRSYYAEAFRRIKSYIREGDCYQVNLAQRFSARAEGDPWDAFRRLRELNPAPYSAFMRVGAGAVLSSSPERFLRVSARRVETKPIKGTRPRSAYRGRDRALADELVNSAKDRAENVMIVDLLRNDLGKNCAAGSIEVPSLCALESFATVHHLVSTVTGTLAPDRDALDLLRGCFPGGSITGAPKLRAMQIIEELEPHRRSVYCGAIGYIDHSGDMDTNIAIRTLAYNDGWLHCWAGGGIVMDSALEGEYQESLDKAAAMLKLFGASEIRRVGG